MSGRADAGWDGRTRLARLHSQGRTGTGKKTLFPVQLTTSRISNHTQLIYESAGTAVLHTVRRNNVLLEQALNSSYHFVWLLFLWSLRSGRKKGTASTPGVCSLCDACFSQ